MNYKEICKVLVKAAEDHGLPVTLDAIFGRNIRISLGFSAKEREKSIDELELSVRSQNALKRAGIDTFDELIGVLAEEKLKNIRNLGAKSFREIQTKLLVYGYECLTEKGKQDFFRDVVELNCPG